MFKALALALLIWPRLGFAACAAGTLDYNTLDNTLNAVCGNTLTQSGTVPFTTSGSPPSPNTYWAGPFTGPNYAYVLDGSISPTLGTLEGVFRTGSDVTTGQAVSGIRGGGRWGETYISSGTLYFFNLTPGIALTYGGVSANTTYYYGHTWSSSGVDLWLGTTPANCTLVAHSALVPNTGAAITGATYGYNADLGSGPFLGYLAQMRLSNVRRTSIPTNDSPATATPTPNWTATATPTRTPSPVPCGTVNRIVQYGDSFQVGFGCAPTLDGSRYIAVNDLQVINGRSVAMAGVGTSGVYLECPYTDAVSGYTTAQILALMQTRLHSELPSPTMNDVLWLGGGVAGQILGESASTIAANWAAMMDYWAAWCPGPIVLVNPAWAPGYDFTVTNAAYVSATAYARAQGYNFANYNSFYSLSVNASAYVCPSPDSLHPNEAALKIMGHAIAVTINAALWTKTITPTYTISATLTRTPTPTPTATRTQTKTRTATVSKTPTRTHTLTRTRTATKTETKTPTPTPSRTATRTLTATRTETQTRTATRTATRTRTRTVTRTFTITKTATRTTTPTATPTQTP